MDVRVSVPQPDGEIRIAVDGDDPVVYTVVGGQVDVPEEALVRFLTVIDGAEVLQDQPGGVTVDVVEDRAVVEVTGDGTGTALPEITGDPVTADATDPGFGPQED